MSNFGTGSFSTLHSLYMALVGLAIAGETWAVEEAWTTVKESTLLYDKLAPTILASYTTTDRVNCLQIFWKQLSELISFILKFRGHPSSVFFLSESSSILLIPLIRTAWHG